MVDSPNRQSTPPVLCFGEALVDLIATEQVQSLDSANSFVARNGGAPANVAVALARLGIASAFCGAVGDDPFGRRLTEGLATDGVDTSRVVRRPATTTIAFAWKNERGDGNFWLLRGADASLTRLDVAQANLSAASAIVVGSVALAAPTSRAAINHAVDLAVRAHVPVCFDVNLRASLWPDLRRARAACRAIQSRATLLKLSLDDARGLLGGSDDPSDIMRVLAGSGAPIIVITDGERGSWYRAGDGAVRFVPAFRVDAVEPTGAGDAFLAALISRFISRGWSAPEDADIEYASAAGALATLRHGAWDGLPTSSELEEFLRSPSAKGR